MILYFSGTGNTRYVALSLGALLGEQAADIRNLNAPEIKFEGERLIICFPVYSWGIPPVVRQFIGALPDNFMAAASGHGIWGVCTCGDETGLVPGMLRSILRRRGAEMRAFWSVTMPNNYVLLPGFNTDPAEVESAKLKAAPARLRHIAGEISRGSWTSDYIEGPWPRLKSRIIYPLFVRFGITPSCWKAGSACIGCGRCVRSCPVSNIRLATGRHPEWGNRCVSCLACYHTCPTHAVSYGRATRGKGQYLCPLNAITPQQSQQTQPADPLQ